MKQPTSSGFSVVSDRTVYIEIISQEHMKPTLFNRIKVAIWNFILPPHIHLNIKKEED